MRVPRLLPLTVTISVVVLLVGGCSDDGSTARSSAHRLGGQVPDRVDPPSQAMDSLERPVVRRLARQLARDGLTLEYLACPPWDKTVPRRLTCRGYVDGLVAQVRVDLTASAGHHVEFDARMADGMVATRKLERTLRRAGWTGPDCGDVAAYPAEPGSRIRCRVSRAGRDRYVVATVENGAGGVRIAADRVTPAG